MSTRLIVPFYVCLVFIAIVSGTCFWIDGTVAPDRFTCYDLNSVGASMCCDSAFSKDFDKCIGGICVYNYSSGARGLYDHGQSFYRDSCTDRAWQDPACLAMAPYIESSQTRLTMCSDGNFCPRTTKDTNMTCCENGQGQSAANLGAPLLVDSASNIQPLPSTQLTSILVTISLEPTSLRQSNLTPSTIPFSSSTPSSNVLPPDTSTTALPTSKPLSFAAEIATILASIFAGFSLLAALVFGIRSCKSRNSHRLLAQVI